MKIAICLISNPILKMAYSPYEPSHLLGHVATVCGAEGPHNSRTVERCRSRLGKKKKSRKAWRSCLPGNSLRPSWNDSVASNDRG